MQFSAQEKCGLRCLLQVARHEGDEPLQIPEIAAREGLSHDYTAKLMRCLRRGGLVLSTRGASGGYRLARSAEKISVSEALSVLGSPLFAEEFCDTQAATKRGCVHLSDCSMRTLWRSVQSAVSGVLRDLTLADMTRAEDAPLKKLRRPEMKRRGARAKAGLTKESESA